MIFAVPILLILGLKRRRRNRRRRAPTPALLISGGWDEVVDFLRDLGRPVPPTATRRELAITAMSAGIGDYAARVDASVFGAHEPTADDAGALWSEALATCRRLVHSVGPLDRVRCALNVTSLRPARIAGPGSLRSLPPGPERPGLGARPGTAGGGGKRGALLAAVRAGWHRNATYRAATFAGAFTNVVFGFLRAAVLIATLKVAGTSAVTTAPTRSPTRGSPRASSW